MNYFKKCDCLFLVGKQYSDYILDLSSINRIDLSSQWVNEFDDNHQLYEELSHIKELKIRRNLLGSWSKLCEVLQIHFTRLESVDVSNSRMQWETDRLSNQFVAVKELVLVETENDCPSFEQILKAFPNLLRLHLDLNRLTFISDELVRRIENLTFLSLSDNPTLKYWNPFVNRLGKLEHLQELILNNCGIEIIDQGFHFVVLFLKRWKKNIWFVRFIDRHLSFVKISLSFWQ